MSDYESRYAYGQALAQQADYVANNWQGKPTLRDQMERRLEDTKLEVKRIEELLALLEKNPDVQRIMELMR